MVAGGRRAWPGTLLLIFLATATGLAIAEGAVRALGVLQDGRDEVARLVAHTEPPSLVSPNVLHPFRGRSRRSGIAPAGAGHERAFPEGETTAWHRANLRTNLHGYNSAIEDYRTVSADRFAVGVFGGSVASGLCTIGGEDLIAAIEGARPELAGRVVLLNFGFPAYKQPQQLAALMEAILLGIRLDAVVNLDGFNELSEGGKDAIEGFHPLFPSRAQYAGVLDLARAAPSHERLELAGRILAHRRRARALAVWSAGSRLRSSALVSGLVGRVCLVRERRALGLEQELERLTPGAARDPIAQLPDPRLGLEEPPWELIAEIWQMASVLMASMAREAGASYLHVLQPNQYVPGSKRFSAEEKARAFAPDTKWARVGPGYAHLQRRGVDLVAQGVDFVDATGVFAEHEGTVYRDTCCHLTIGGYRVLGKLIATHVVRQIAARDAAVARGGPER